MADVVITKDDGSLEYLPSVNTGDYVTAKNVTKDHITPKEGVLINPDVSHLEDVDVRYWKRVGNDLIEMSEEEKGEIDKRDIPKKEDVSIAGDLSASDLAVVLIKKGVITKEDLNG